MVDDRDTQSGKATSLQFPVSAVLCAMALAVGGSWLATTAYAAPSATAKVVAGALVPKAGLTEADKLNKTFRGYVFTPLVIEIEPAQPATVSVILKTKSRSVYLSNRQLTQHVTGAPKPDFDQRFGLLRRRLDGYYNLALTFQKLTHKTHQLFFAFKKQYGVHASDITVRVIRVSGTYVLGT